VTDSSCGMYLQIRWLRMLSPTHFLSTSDTSSKEFLAHTVVSICYASRHYLLHSSREFSGCDSDFANAKSESHPFTHHFMRLANPIPETCGYGLKSPPATCSGLGLAISRRYSLAAVATKRKTAVKTSNRLAMTS
jgi:hypothetical protein